MTMLLPTISEQVNGIIWRIEIDETTSTLCLEVRNTEDKQVSFASINLTNGITNFKELTTPERWLTGMEAVYNGVLLLHHYQSEKSPVHKAIVAIDVTTGNTLWSNYTYAFDSLTVNGPIVYNIQVQPKKLLLADVKTGTALRSFEHLIDSEILNNIIAPQLLPNSALPQQLKIEPHGNIIHYLEYNKLIIVSLHTFNVGLLQQHIYILDGADVVYEDILNTDIQKLQPEAFIVHKNCLIYIKNRSELKVINL